MNNACTMISEMDENVIRDCTIAHALFEELLEFEDDATAYSNLVDRFIDVFGRIVRYVAETRKSTEEDPTEAAFYMIDNRKHAVTRIHARKI